MAGPKPGTLSNKEGFGASLTPAPSSLALGGLKP